MTQMIQKNHSSLSSSQFFNIEMSAIILLFFCVVWFFTRDIWINDTQAVFLASKGQYFFKFWVFLYHGMILSLA